MVKNILCPKCGQVPRMTWIGLGYGSSYEMDKLKYPERYKEERGEAVCVSEHLECDCDCFYRWDEDVRSMKE